MGEADAHQIAGWFADPLTRRAVFGLFGLTAIVAACSDDAASGPPNGATSAVTLPTTAATATALPAVTSTTDALTVPLETQPVQQNPDPSFVPGINVNVNSEVLQADSEAYGGSWSGAWAFDDGSAAGTMSADVVFDVTRRTITGHLVVEGPLLAVPVPAMDVNVSVDSWIYGDDGTFQVAFYTAAGQWSMTSDGGFGKFRLHIDAVEGSEVVAFDATGVANRPSLIPVAFTISGSTRSTTPGTINWTPA